MSLDIVSPEWKDILYSFTITKESVNYLTRSIIDCYQEAPILSWENIWKPDMVGSIKLNHHPITLLSFSAMKWWRIFLCIILLYLLHKQTPLLRRVE